MHAYGVFIGRFQPFHNAHLKTVKFALDRVDRLLIVVGSDNQARTVKNPWTTAERIEMIKAAVGEGAERLVFVPAKDYPYINNLWVRAVQEAIDQATDGSDDVKLIGHSKDASSFYLRLFPQWGGHIETGTWDDVDASRIRGAFFQQDKVSLKGMLPKEVYDLVAATMDTPEYQRLHEEYHEVLNDKMAWTGAPYQPTFVTTDAVVICSGHVLVVRRRGKYGRGLIALPGGYINANEELLTSCIRELREETAIKVESRELKTLVVDKEVFDHPGRDLRGRVITHAYCIRLPDGPLPRVKGMDDADKAWWMPLRDVFAREPEFFADHYHIINRFVNRF